MTLKSWASSSVFTQISPVQVGCMRQVLGAGALGKPRGMGWGGRWEGGSGWGTHVNPWLIHVNIWQNPLQYCKVISLQIIKRNGKKNMLQFSSVQSLSPVQFSVTLWTTAWQTSLSITNSRSLPKMMSIESEKPSNHVILCHPLLLLPSTFPHDGLFKWVSSSHEMVKVLEFQLQHQSFQWTPRMFSFRMD